MTSKIKKRGGAKMWASIVLIGCGLLAAAGLVARWYVFQRPLPLREPHVEFRVAAGSSVRGIALAAQAAGIALNADAMVAVARLTGSTQSLRAGRYVVEPVSRSVGCSPSCARVM